MTAAQSTRGVGGECVSVRRVEIIGVEVKSSSTFLAAKRWSQKAATAKSQPNSHRHARGLPELGATAQAVDAHRTLHLSGCACGNQVRMYQGVQLHPL